MSPIFCFGPEVGQLSKILMVKLAKMPKDSRKLTLGQYFRLVEDRCFISENTLYEYQSSARNLYSRAFSVGKGLSKYDYVNGGNEAWREKVESIPVFSITLAQIERHRKAFLSARKVEELQSGRTTFNKVLRNTKALFGRKVRRILEKTNSNPTGVEFPDDFPFDKLQMEKEGSKRFHLNRQSRRHGSEDAHSRCKAGVLRIFRAFTRRQGTWPVT